MKTTAIIQKKKSDEKRFAYMIENKWMSTFDMNNNFEIGNSVNVEYLEKEVNGKVYYNIQRMELNEMKITKIEKPMTTDLRIARSVYLKLATDVLIAQNNFKVDKMVELAQMIETECTKQKYL